MFDFSNFLGTQLDNPKNESANDLEKGEKKSEAERELEDFFASNDVDSSIALKLSQHGVKSLIDLRDQSSNLEKFGLKKLQARKIEALVSTHMSKQPKLLDRSVAPSKQASEASQSKENNHMERSIDEHVSIEPQLMDRSSAPSAQASKLDHGQGKKLIERTIDERIRAAKDCLVLPLPLKVGDNDQAIIDLEENGFQSWDFVEVFKVGDGYAFLYGGWVLMREIMRAFKAGGMPFAGQIVSVMKEMETFPVFGDVFVAFMGKASRPSYKVCGAPESMHPQIDTFWTPPPKPKCSKAETIEAPLAPGPQMFGNYRATPEFNSICDFSKTIQANERSEKTTNFLNFPLFTPERWGLVEQVLFFGSRGFKLRFKVNQGGDTVFNLFRQGPGTIFYFLGVAAKIAGYFNLRCFVEVFMPSSSHPQSGITVKAADNKKILGNIETIEHKGFCNPHGILRNRFIAQPKPLYDVKDAEGKSLFQVVLPVKKQVFCGIKMWYDEDYLAILRSEDVQALTIENEWSLPNDSGWVIALRPRLKDKIDKALAMIENFRSTLAYLSCGWTNLCFRFFVQISVAFIALLRTLPIDNVTQVPNPGVADVRAATPCSHTIGVIRAKIPSALSDIDRILFQGVLIWIQHEEMLEYI